MSDIVELRPQEGPQEAFLSSEADIVIYGGAAGGGKSFGLLMEPLRYITHRKDFAAVYFRRNTTQIKNPGGLWDESMKIYPSTGGIPVTHTLEWKWKKGGKIKMAHLEHESTVHDWQGSQIPLICFDELTHFSKKMFFYMLSRNRSVSGIKPYIRASTNPDADSWVAEFIQWWWDPKTGIPIFERSGVVRYFIRISDEIMWASSKQELIEQYGNPDLPWDHDDQVQPKSMTFIPARLEDNKILMKADPGYKANLLSMSLVERERLLGGNWKIRPAAGLYFQRSQAPKIKMKPKHSRIKWVRRWDLAATIPSEENPDPDWTVGTLMGKYPDGRFVIADQVRVRANSNNVRKLVKKTAKADGKKVKISIPQDPGQAGKEQAKSYVTMLVGFTVKTIRESGKKEVRADPYAAQWQAGNVDVVEGPWNDDMYDEYEMFPEGPHDDCVDTGTGAFIFLIGKNNGKLLGKPTAM